MQAIQAGPTQDNRVRTKKKGDKVSSPCELRKKERRQEKTREDKRRQEKTREDKRRQEKTREDNRVKVTQHY
jgi:hypothetical protein